MLTNKEIEAIINKVYLGVINAFNLPENLYLDTGNNLQEAVYQGYGGSKEKFDIETSHYQTLDKMTNNTWRFSAAKCFKNIVSMQGFVFDEKGFKIPFNQFYLSAKQSYDIYNVAWLEAEYEACVSQGISARQWAEFEDSSEFLPLLQYETVGDSRVRPSHKSMDGIVRKVNDEFWNKFMPPNGWRCRCNIIQLSEGKQTKLSKSKLAKIEKETEPMFLMNAGKDKVVFKESVHPYFKVDKRFAELKKNNFNLPLP